MNIQEIKTQLSSISDTDYDGISKFILDYSNDLRSGVVTTVNQAKKKLVQLETEYLRSEKMLSFEKKYRSLGHQAICGIDEVGRGPLAGPVVACAVILPTDDTILYLNDSKQLSAKKREQLYEEIIERAVAYGIGIVSEQRIDEINILQATYEAMRMAISNLSVTPDLLLNDAVRIPEVEIKQVPIVKGDTLSASIAAASIVAKVTRDRMMKSYDEIYPGYDFSSNMGYGSAKHIEALKKNGPTPIHRKSFISNFIEK
ncbi:MAG: ribonuclease HII [Eubacteriales bacterium]|nr:ribonuclease HII [Lachnospiraceae bacterium]MDO5127058.1 ribonuclease HII [Eubacteriales bacterium]